MAKYWALRILGSQKDDDSEIGVTLTNCHLVIDWQNKIQSKLYRAFFKWETNNRVMHQMLGEQLIKADDTKLGT